MGGGSSQDEIRCVSIPWLCDMMTNCPLDGIVSLGNNANILNGSNIRHTQSARQTGRGSERIVWRYKVRRNRNPENIVSLETFRAS